MKGLLGVKVGMTQVFDEHGVVTPVTLIQAGPCFVTQIKTDDSDGYSAVQIGYQEVKEKRLSKGELGHLGLVKASKKRPKRKKNNDVPAVRHLNEFRTKNLEGIQLGQQLTVEQFELGEKVDVTGTTKGRGFAGTVKRHGFAGGPKTHGQSDRWRAPGSIGATSGIAHVFKGTRMSGQMGNVRHTTQNLQIVRIDSERNLIAVKGAIPGSKGGLVIIRAAAKGG